MTYKYYDFYNILRVIILPSFAKSLSLHRDIQPFAEYAVTPFVGVWIETFSFLILLFGLSVTPFVGVWIETQLLGTVGNTLQSSHPSWVCGLKLTIGICCIILSRSHPSWVCGLKHKIPFEKVEPVTSHTLRGCVD